MQRNFSQLRAFFLIYLVNTIIFSTTVNAQKSPNIDLSLIVGEWSEKGKCNFSRYVFTKKGKYQSFFQENGRWKLFFDGSYARKNTNSVTITHTTPDNNTFEDLLEISSLNRKTLSGTLYIVIGDDEKEKVSWQRCPTR
ncbi:hypothetical protein H6G25_07810 [Dolichospermum sp. FACHB-1091]|uniref:hypothetical protein n=1 Tax=Dolichospermum sp. FACHB-1091 TaxID=2692798 RepID=UPI0016806ABB|nr:hypothetical protein [Dolichospermum sp. FACHB-1091]MBD2443105.1 hypothetical protein [Dolichospermum sp. FACHB-1091]